MINKAIGVTGIILAGGKSSRMGYDKGLALVNGKTMIELVYAALAPVVDEVIVIANTDSYDYMNLPVFEDIYKEVGPIGGIYTGLFHSPTEKNLIVACDMPFVTTELLAYILKHSGDKQIVVPKVKDHLEPLCGYYKKEITERLKELIEKKIIPVHEVIEFFDYHAVVMDDKTMMGEKVFTNINKPEDLII